MVIEEGRYKFVIWSLEEKHKLELPKDAVSGDWDRWASTADEMQLLSF